MGAADVAAMLDFVVNFGMMSVLSLLIVIAIYEECGQLRR